jgi:hypothetical protein
VKVAISVVIFAFHMAEGQSISKDSFQKTVSIQEQRISFEEVLNRLSKQTKLYFIYSSNSVELNKQLSLHVTQRPLQEVLAHLEKTLNVNFRREGNYVVVKAANEAKVANQVEKVSVPQKHLTATKTTANTDESLVATTKQYSVIQHRTIVPYDLLKKNLLYCSPATTKIDTSNLKKYFPLSITNPKPNRSVFTSFGFMANEYSGGVEMRLGLPSIYGVVNTGLMRGGSFRVGYGLGTSIAFKPKVWLNPIYTFAKVSEEEDYLVDGNFNLLMQNGLKITGKHHQLKLLFQMQLSRRLMAQFGPSINFLNTSYQYDKAFFTAGFISGDVISPSPDSGYYPRQTRIVRTIYYSSPPDYTTSKRWVGFEVGLSYSVKFSHRR